MRDIKWWCFFFIRPCSHSVIGSAARANFFHLFLFVVSCSCSPSIFISRVKVILCPLGHRCHHCLPRWFLLVSPFHMSKITQPCLSCLLFYIAHFIHTFFLYLHFLFFPTVRYQLLCTHSSNIFTISFFQQ